MTKTFNPCLFNLLTLITKKESGVGLISKHLYSLVQLDESLQVPEGLSKTLFDFRKVQHVR